MAKMRIQHKSQPTTRLGKTLRELRYDHRYTTYVISEALEVTTQAISGWETGKTIPRESTLVALANFYGLPPTFFFSDYIKDLGERAIKRGNTFIKIKSSTLETVLKERAKNAE